MGALASALVAEVLPPVAAPLPVWKAFWVGVVGAGVVYYLLYRDTRILEFLNHPKENWRVLCFDLFFFLTCAGALSALWGEPKTMKEAFTTGCTWQGLAGALLAGTELKILKNRVKSARPPRQQKKRDDA
jgi:hypothetical protein